MASLENFKYLHLHPPQNMLHYMLQYTSCYYIMHHTTILCIMLLYYALCYYIMHHATILCIMLLYYVSCYYIIHHDTISCIMQHFFIVLKRFEFVQQIWCARILYKSMHAVCIIIMQFHKDVIACILIL